MLIAAMFMGGCTLIKKPAPTQWPPPQPEEAPAPPQAVEPKGFGEDVAYAPSPAAIAPTIAADFSIADVKNMAAMEKAYGVSFTAAERKALAERKFVMKNLLDTSIRPSATGDNVREFVQLYGQVQGPADYRLRGQEHAMFYSADLFLHAYNNLYVELLKEMENETFFPAMRALTGDFFQAAKEKAVAASTNEERKKWIKVRDYFAVPYAILSTAGSPLTPDDYYKDGVMRDPADVQAEHDAADERIDTEERVAAFLKGLGLGAVSESALLADIKKVYAADDKGVPSVFAEEYVAYARQEDVEFKVDFTQFTPRGTYTSSSLRRQYFRGMKWLIQIPFFLKSPDLTSYAFGVTQLMAENSRALADYDKLESAIGFMVGTSDDLMPVDYLSALEAGKSQSDPSAAAMAYLVKARDPKIKDLAAEYATVGEQQTDEVRLKTKGMRFFSGKFIIDSYWTGFLTQGDEAPRPGYSQKLPPMASSLQVMALLGSSYAERQIPKLDFHAPSNAEAMAQALGELKAETAKLTDADWRKNLYTGWLWTIKSLFSWQAEHASALPMFMRSEAWAAKTLMTASASWAELRHATILYAKQSFAEYGAGFNDECDVRPIPEPPKAYIEPQVETYARLSYLAKRTASGLKGMGYDLSNMGPLERFIAALETVQTYVHKELGDSTLTERVVTSTRPDPQDETKTCTEQVLEQSDWEALRLDLMTRLKESVPVPVEGPVLPAKDRRAALVADVHTGGDFTYPPKILYEATGVPYVIFVAVKDANGARLTVGFTSSHHEFVKPYGGKRMTDEEWQVNFYEGTEPYEAFIYTDKKKWPAPNAWYAPLFDLR